MNKYEKYTGMTSDDLTEACIELEAERDMLKKAAKNCKIKHSNLCWAEIGGQCTCGYETLKTLIK